MGPRLTPSAGKKPVALFLCGKRKNSARDLAREENNLSFDVVLKLTKKKEKNRGGVFGWGGKGVKEGLGKKQTSATIAMGPEAA